MNRKIKLAYLMMLEGAIDNLDSIEFAVVFRFLNDLENPEVKPYGLEQRISGKMMYNLRVY